MFTEKTLESKIVYKGKILDVEKQKVLLINGDEASREIVRHSGAACMAAIDKDLNFYFVRQFRKAFDKETLEISAGKLEKGEDPYECAVRELKEETGLVPGKVTSLGVLYSAPGFCDEVLHVFLAQDLTQGEKDPDPGEFLKVEKYPLKECVEMVSSGQIHDAKTIVAILQVAMKFKIN